MAGFLPSLEFLSRTESETDLLLYVCLNFAPGKHKLTEIKINTETSDDSHSVLTETGRGNHEKQTQSKLNLSITCTDLWKPVQIKSKK